jgi:uncharacterized protein (DUF608 family)
VALPYDRETLFAEGGTRVLAGEALRAVRFPVGGIGTGTISVAGSGDLVDFEIFNRPAKGRALPFTFVSVWAERPSEAPRLRVARAEPLPPFAGPESDRLRGAGLPHFAEARFSGGYPFCRVELRDDDFPVTVELEAWNPMVPLSVDDSSLPVAILTYSVVNPFYRESDVVLAFSLVNPVGHDWRSPAGLQHASFDGNTVEASQVAAGVRGTMSLLSMTAPSLSSESLNHGSVALGTLARDAETAVYGADTWDETVLLAREHAEHLRVHGRLLPARGDLPTTPGRTCFATVAPRFRLQPHARQSVTFILGWHFPNRENDWNNEAEVKGARLRNQYAVRFSDAAEVVTHTARNLPRLEEQTRAFHRALFATTVPGVLLDAASSQMSILRTTTCMLLESEAGRGEGALFGFEGSGPDRGSFPLNCTHVWNYAQAAAYLFPSLERAGRRMDFLWNLFDDGSMAFRTLVPLGKRLWDWYAAADGQMGTILRLYREWQLSADRDFLAEVYPQAKRAMEHAFVYWDADRDGVIEGEQHTTYDIELYGPNTMVGTLYLGALRAMAEMARALDDVEGARRYGALARRGRAGYERLWNGGYFAQQVPDAGAIVPPPTSGANENQPALRGVSGGDVKHQVGPGCLSDQLLGQWLATQMGLGYLLDPGMVRGALAAVFRNNFRSSFRERVSSDRVYARGRDRGLVVCSWPRGGRPRSPLLYSDETWAGVEYQVAAHLLFEGYAEEALAVVKAARDRHDGERGNPWDDEEAGHHYARSMSSWSLLLAASGFSYAAPLRRIGFAPRFRPHDFSTFFSTGHGWGVFTQQLDAGDLRADLALRFGRLEVEEVQLAAVEGQSDPQRVRALVRDRGASFDVPARIAREGRTLRVMLASPVALSEGGALNLNLRLMG